MNEIEVKNPRAIGGETPLHLAAAGGHLETFKMIVDKAGTNINPSDNRGWTPLHCAAANGHKEMCKFIVDKVDEKNPETNSGLTPQKLMWDSICRL
jgi:ankyrin repeat protein